MTGARESLRGAVSCAFVVTLALAGACGGRQTLDLPPGFDDGTGGSAGLTGGAGVTGAAGTTATGGAGGVPSTTGAAGSSFMEGALDLAAAPPTFSMICGGGIGSITFADPCSIGGNVNAGTADPSAPGPHEVECNILNGGTTVAFSFLMMFPPSQNPQQVVLTPTATGVAVNASGQTAQVSKMTGWLTLDFLDLTQRAFAGQLDATVDWIEPTGATFECRTSAPLWAGPGAFN